MALAVHPVEVIAFCGDLPQGFEKGKIKEKKETMA